MSRGKHVLITGVPGNHIRLQIQVKFLGDTVWTHIIETNKIVAGSHRDEFWVIVLPSDRADWIDNAVFLCCLFRQFQVPDIKAIVANRGDHIGMHRMTFNLLRLDLSCVFAQLWYFRFQVNFSGCLELVGLAEEYLSHGAKDDESVVTRDVHTFDRLTQFGSDNDVVGVWGTDEVFWRCLLHRLYHRLLHLTSNLTKVA